MRKQIAMVFMALCVMTLFAAGAVADANIGVGDYVGEATVPITVTVADNVGAVDVTLEYDPAVISLVSVTDGDMDATVVNAENAGVVRIGAYQTSSDGLYGEFVIANVAIKPNSDKIASCDLDISVTTFKDATPAGNSMAYSITDGKYSTSPDKVPGFLGVFAIFVILTVAYVMYRGKK